MAKVTINDVCGVTALDPADMARVSGGTQGFPPRPDRRKYPWGILVTLPEQPPVENPPPFDPSTGPTFPIA
jgi:hypothetical protein